jgi:hypothetical protein
MIWKHFSLNLATKQKFLSCALDFDLKSSHIKVLLVLVIHKDNENGNYSTNNFRNNIILFISISEIIFSKSIKTNSYLNRGSTLQTSVGSVNWNWI